ncbi:hypothetical protein Hamer_G011795, partial [Homarus americanus]
MITFGDWGQAELLKTVTSINKFPLQVEIQELIGEVFVVKKLKKRDEKSTSALSRLSDGRVVALWSPSRTGNNVVYGIISYTELEHMKNNKMEELLGNIVVQRKLSRPDGGATSALVGFFYELLKEINHLEKKKNDRTSKAALAGYPRNPPSEVLLGGSPIPVRPCEKTPTKCYKCQSYGHLTKKNQAQRSVPVWDTRTPHVRRPKIYKKQERTKAEEPERDKREKEQQEPQEQEKERQEQEREKMTLIISEFINFFKSLPSLEDQEKLVFKKKERKKKEEIRRTRL